MSNQSSPRSHLTCDNGRAEYHSEKNKEDLEISYEQLSQDFTNNGAGDEGSQTRSDSGCNTENPISRSTLALPPYLQRSRAELAKNIDKATKSARSRNPITGMGLNGDGVGGLKPLKPKGRTDGNPVTGEGYKSNDFNHTPSLNGANQVINKNRIPPGGFSSGLW